MDFPKTFAEVSEFLGLRVLHLPVGVVGPGGTRLRYAACGTDYNRNLFAGGFSVESNIAM